MTQLLEITSVRQVHGEARRRWFTSTALDLFVWFDGDGATVAFQFAYDKEKRERTLTWKQGAGFVHNAVDDGENHIAPRYKATPVLRADEQPDIDRVVDLLVTWGIRLPPDIAAFVANKIREYPPMLTP